MVNRREQAAAAAVLNNTTQRVDFNNFDTYESATPQNGGRYNSLNPKVCVPDYSPFATHATKELDKIAISKGFSANSNDGTGASKTSNVYSEIQAKIDECIVEIEDQDLIKGHQNAQQILWQLDNYQAVKRAPCQKMFHKEFFQASLPQIYTPTVWERNELELLLLYCLAKVLYEVFVVAPRRFGKSHSVAMWIVAILIIVVCVVINVYSQGQRASSSLMKLIIKYFRKVTGWMEQYSIKQQGQEDFVIVNLNDDSDSRVVHCYPSSKRVRCTHTTTTHTLHGTSFSSS